MDSKSVVLVGRMKVCKVKTHVFLPKKIKKVRQIVANFFAADYTDFHRLKKALDRITEIMTN
jgi:hypothetical protein